MVVPAFSRVVSVQHSRASGSKHFRRPPACAAGHSDPPQGCLPAAIRLMGLHLPVFRPGGAVLLAVNPLHFCANPRLSHDLYPPLFYRCHAMRHRCCHAPAGGLRHRGTSQPSDFFVDAELWFGPHLSLRCVCAGHSATGGNGARRPGRIDSLALNFDPAGRKFHSRASWLRPLIPAPGRPALAACDRRGPAQFFGPCAFPPAPALLPFLCS